jgi:hypothetical protein
MKPTADNVQHVLRHALGATMRIRWWVWGLILVGIIWLPLARIDGPGLVNVVWGPSTRFCGVSYVKVQNNSFWPLRTDGWWFGDRFTQYQFPNRWLLPGTAIRLWPGNGTNDMFNLYAGGTATDWELSSASVKEFPEGLAIAVSCDVF